MYACNVYDGMVGFFFLGRSASSYKQRQRGGASPAMHCATLSSLTGDKITSVVVGIRSSNRPDGCLKISACPCFHFEPRTAVLLLCLPCANPTSTDACVWNQEPAVAQAVATELLPFQERGDWDGALQVNAMIPHPFLCGV